MVNEPSVFEPLKFYCITYFIFRSMTFHVLLFLLHYLLALQTVNLGIFAILLFEIKALKKASKAHLFETLKDHFIAAVVAFVIVTEHYESSQFKTS